MGRKYIEGAFAMLKYSVQSGAQIFSKLNDYERAVIEYLTHGAGVENQMASRTDIFVNGLKHNNSVDRDRLRGSLKRKGLITVKNIQKGKNKPTEVWKLV